MYGNFVVAYRTQAAPPPAGVADGVRSQGGWYLQSDLGILKFWSATHHISRERPPCQKRLDVPQLAEFTSHWLRLHTYTPCKTNHPWRDRKSNLLSPTAFAYHSRIIPIIVLGTTFTPLAATWGINMRWGDLYLHPVFTDIAHYGVHFSHVTVRVIRISCVVVRPF